MLGEETLWAPEDGDGREVEREDSSEELEGLPEEGMEEVELEEGVDSSDREQQSVVGEAASQVVEARGGMVGVESALGRVSSKGPDREEEREGEDSSVRLEEHPEEGLEEVMS